MNKQLEISKRDLLRWENEGGEVATLHPEGERFQRARVHVVQVLADAAPALSTRSGELSSLKSDP